MRAESKDFGLQQVLYFFLLTFFLLPRFAWSTAELSSQPFPTQPIRLVVYTSPGGLIDLTARRFADIAQRYTNGIPIVVINRPGGGGIVAFEEVLQRPADGHTMLAVTRSNISKMVAAGREDLISRLDWHSYIMDNPHVLITHQEGGINHWQQLLEHAHTNKGRQLWLGADIGGVKHVSGVKIAERAGVEMRWIPYSSGGQAIAALLGKVGNVYLGNPRDVLASTELSILAVAASERLAAFPDAPTFSELGITGLEQELIWRGFAFKQGMPEHVRQWYSELIQKVQQDPDWQASWRYEGVSLVYKNDSAFTEIVKRDSAEFRHYLSHMGLIKLGAATDSAALTPAGLNMQPLFGLGLVLGYLLFTRALLRSKLRPIAGELLILIGIVSIAILFYIITLSFPAPSKVDLVGAQGVPKLWIFLLLPLVGFQFFLLFKTLPNTAEYNKKHLVFSFLAMLLSYALLIPILGYWLATLLYLPAALFLLNYIQVKLMLSLSLGWLLFSYFIFQRMLMVDLPKGLLFI